MSITQSEILNRLSIQDRGLHFAFKFCRELGDVKVAIHALCLAAAVVRVVYVASEAVLGGGSDTFMLRSTFELSLASCYSQQRLQNSLEFGTEVCSRC